MCVFDLVLMLQLSMLQIWEEHETSWFWFLFYSGKFCSMFTKLAVLEIKVKSTGGKIPGGLGKSDWYLDFSVPSMSCLFLLFQC